MPTRKTEIEKSEVALPDWKTNPPPSTGRPAPTGEPGTGRPAPTGSESNHPLPGAPGTGTEPPGFHTLHREILIAYIAGAGFDINRVTPELLDLIDLLVRNLLRRYPGYISTPR